MKVLGMSFRTLAHRSFGLGFKSLGFRGFRVWGLQATSLEGQDRSGDWGLLFGVLGVLGFRGSRLQGS